MAVRLLSSPWKGEVQEGLRHFAPSLSATADSRGGLYVAGSIALRRRKFIPIPPLPGQARHDTEKHG